MWFPLTANYVTPVAALYGPSAIYPLDGHEADLWDTWGTIQMVRTPASLISMQVRESGGSTSADISFGADGLLDSSALATHVGANSGFVARLNGQVNGRHLLQATTSRQPRIRNAGVNVAYGSNGLALEVITSDIQRMVTNSVTSYTAAPLTMMVVHCSKAGALTGKTVNVLDATNRSDVSDSLATIAGNGSNGINLTKGDSLANSPGGATTEKTRVIFGVFDGSVKRLYDSVDLPGTSISNTETTAFNFDRVGLWAYTASASWGSAGERIACASVWTRALSGADIATITERIKNIYGIS